MKRSRKIAEVEKLINIGKKSIHRLMRLGCIDIESVIHFFQNPH